LRRALRLPSEFARASLNPPFLHLLPTFSSPLPKQCSHIADSTGTRVRVERERGRKNKRKRVERGEERMQSCASIARGGILRAGSCSWTAKTMQPHQHRRHQPTGASSKRYMVTMEEDLGDLSIPWVAGKSVYRCYSPGLPTISARQAAKVAGDAHVCVVVALWCGVEWSGVRFRVFFSTRTKRLTPPSRASVLI